MAMAVISSMKSYISCTGCSSRSDKVPMGISIPTILGNSSDFLFILKMEF